MPNHYEVLGVARHANTSQIRRAYYDAARTHHPDKHAGAGDEALARAREAMSKVNAAWAVLGDPQRRRAYDATLRETGTPPQASPRPTGPSAPAEEPDERWVDEPSWIGDPDVDEEAQGLRSHTVVLLPVALLASSVAVFAFATMTETAALLLLSILLLSLAAFGFVAAPLLTIRHRTARGTPRDPRA
jgi:curved DNA-binding protein CbpA